MGGDDGPASSRSTSGPARPPSTAHGPGRLGGEGVFVPRPDASTEDDGWLVTYVHDRAEDASELVVLDAHAFDDEPVARVLIPRRVPYGFHGTWLPGDLLGE